MSAATPSVEARAVPAAAAPRLLAVRHETRYDYDAPVEVAHHSAHLRPRDTEWQRVERWRLEIDPEPEGGRDAVQESRDAFGNWRHGFNHARVHERLTVVSSCLVRLLPPPPLARRDSPAWEEAAQALRYRAAVQLPAAVEFALASPYVPCDAALAAFGERAFAAGRPLLDAACALMGLIHREIAYRPLATDVATDARAALQQRQGVCQDFAHLMIGVLRSRGLAARYVSGYLLTRPPPGQPRLVGADASHAWVAVWCPLQGWVALDPTNDCVVGADHVTLAWGRDYGDVAPLRGVIRGGGSAPPRVAVTVEPA